MLGQARIDASGTLHHIIVRGIRRCKMFKDDDDRESLLCFWAVHESGMNMTELSGRLNISVPAVTVSVNRKERLSMIIAFHCLTY